MAPSAKFRSRDGDTRAAADRRSRPDPRQLCHALTVTSTMSLFACAAADVTLERVEELVDQAPPESLTLEFKERYSQGVVKSVAAMANSYGGLILIGVTDRPLPNRLVGVPDTAIVQVANACHGA